MTERLSLRPGENVPELSVLTVGGGSWTTADHPRRSVSARAGESHVEALTLIVFYRGQFCSVCRQHLIRLARYAAEFERRGIEMIAVSADTLERATTTALESGLDPDRVAYGLTSQQMAQWGVYRSEGGGVRPAVYSEPAMFVIRADGTLYWASVQSLPWGSPSPRDIVAGIDFMRERGMQLRGNV